MAKFVTHLNVSAFISAIGASVVVYNKLATINDALVFFATGIVGGLLPDIDHDKSKPLQIVKLFLFLFISLLLTIKFYKTLPILNLALIWLVVYIAISILFYFFKKLTKHRGIIHSIPMGIFFSFLLFFISYYLFGFDETKSYLMGLFLFLGYISHLILDEIYSVDLVGNKIKKSFGSALKFCSNNQASNLLLITLILALFLFLPHKEKFLDILKGFLNV